MDRYRLYLDESGDHTYADLNNPDRRYLGLTGVAIEAVRYREQMQPALEALKRSVFGDSPDDPVVLVRNKIVHRANAFCKLQDPELNGRWEEGLLDFFKNHTYTVFTVVIDKQSHLGRYGDAAFHPYHYCLTVLMERYRGWLKSIGAKGDILAEARGGKEDMTLKDIYTKVWENGTRFRSRQEMQNVLTSRRLKLKRKEQNVGGLQVADLLAYPAREDVLMQNQRSLSHACAPFTQQVHRLLSTKCNAYGRVLLQ